MKSKIIVIVVGSVLALIVGSVNTATAAMEWALEGLSANQGPNLSANEPVQLPIIFWETWIVFAVIGLIGGVIVWRGRRNTRSAASTGPQPQHR